MAHSATAVPRHKNRLRGPDRNTRYVHGSCVCLRNQPIYHTRVSPLVRGAHLRPASNCERIMNIAVAGRSSPRIKFVKAWRSRRDP